MTRRGLLASVLLAGVLASRAALAAPTVTPVLFTDVTDRSFAAVWLVDEAAGGTVRVFSDPNGTTEITSTLRVTAQSPAHPPAETLGVIRVRVSGLAPATTVYVRSETTSQATSAVTVEPPTAPLPGVTLQGGLRRSDDTAAAIVNDALAVEVLAPDGVSPSPGTLLVVSVAGSSSPLSVFVGDGASTAFALVDLNNLFDPNRASSWLQTGNEPVTLTALGGSAGLGSLTGALPLPSGLGLIQSFVFAPVPLAPASGPDSDGDVFPDLVDNCPATANLDQADGGRVGPGGGDGIGDPCQCGDTDGDAGVDLADVSRLRRALAGLPPGLRVPGKCNVIGPTDPADLDGDGLPDDCDAADAVVLRRALAGLPPAPAQVCDPALP